MTGPVASAVSLFRPVRASGTFFWGCFTTTTEAVIHCSGNLNVTTAGQAEDDAVAASKFWNSLPSSKRSSPARPVDPRVIDLSNMRTVFISLLIAALVNGSVALAALY
jgi:hypothetical protein